MTEDFWTGVNSGKKVGLLSNMPKELSQFLRRELPELSLFDPCLFSAQIGLIKPEAECYEVALKQLELAAEEVLFIDDSETNILAAANLGLQTLKFTHINQLLSLR